MATLAVFICPERIGVARVKAAGAKPCYATPIWQPVEDAQKLLAEPALLASLIREMVGDEDKYQIYMSVWPGAFKAVMFSYPKRNKKDVQRLRKAELEVVFHGDLSDQYTYDLPMDKGRYSFGGKSRRIIYTYPKGRLKLMTAALRERKMKLQRLVPMDAAACEAALQYWAPEKKTINACIVLDEGCTAIALLRRGAIQAMRTIPNGCSSVLSSYMQITGQDIDTCLDMIRQNGVNATEDNEMPTIQDNLMRTVNKLVGELVKMLHTTFGEGAVLDKVLLCGNFVDTVDLVSYTSNMLGTECVVADEASLKRGATAAIALNGDDLSRLFPLATTTCADVDLMQGLKAEIADRNKTIVLCGIVTVILGGLMILTPLEKKRLEEQSAAYTDMLEQPAYLEVRDAIDRKQQAGRQKQNLIEAIEKLPHGGSNTAGLVSDVMTITSAYGRLTAISVDYNTEAINVSLMLNNYDLFIYWQQEITKGGRFSFIQPPSFTGNGSSYVVSATLKATDFTENMDKEG